MEAAAVPPDEFDAFLRREGVHEAELEPWCIAAIEGAKAALEGGIAGFVAHFVAREDECMQKSARLVETACANRNVDPRGLVLHSCRQVYERARRKHPNRWSRGARGWSPATTVFLHPKRNRETVASLEHPSSRRRRR